MFRHFNYYYLNNKEQMGKSSANSQHLDTGNFTSANESYLGVELSHVQLNWSYYILTIRERCSAWESCFHLQNFKTL